MKDWYSKEFDKATGNTTANWELLPSWNSFAEGRDLIPLAAVLRREDQGTGKVTFYITPQAVDYAEKVGAEPCEMPAQDGWIYHWAGDPRALESYYPTGERW